MDIAIKKPNMQVLDMTTGNPLKLILRFAIPLFIGNIFQQIYGIVDTMVVGYTLGDQAISALGATASLYSLLINISIGMNSGFAIITTQSFGAHNKKRLKQAIAGTFVLNSIITCIVTAFSLIFLRSLLIFMNTPATIFDDAYIYIFIICAGMITTIGYNMCAGILQAVGNSLTPLLFLILSCILNIILDILFVVIIPLGVSGAALATVIAQGISAILCGVYIFQKYKDILPEKSDFRIPKSLVKNMISSGLAMALMYCIVDLGTVIFQRSNNALGDVYITAHTAARRILFLSTQPSVSIATALSTFTGQNWGAKNVQRIKKTLKQILVIELLYGLAAIVLLFFIGGFLVKFTTGTTNPVIIENAVLSLRIHLLFFPALEVLFCLRTSMQAMGFKTAPVISSCIELGMKIVSAIWLVPAVGFIGTCLTEPLIWFVMMIYLIIAYTSIRKKMLTHEKGQAY